MRTAIWITLIVVHLAVIVRAILLDGRESYSRAAWLLLLIAMPGIGTLLYLLFGEPWISAGFRNRSREAYEALLADVGDEGGAAAGSPEAANAFRTCAAAARWPVSVGNQAQVAPEGDPAIDMVIADIDAAATTVHLSFYIWLGDGNGTKVVEAVCRAARRGVTCRVVADAIGSHAMIKSEQWRQMREAGARMCASLSVPFGLGFLVGHRTDLRNHRKIVVIDGRVTWCGSQNCADPAFLPKRKFAPWVDILIRYEGPVARQVERIFGAAWMAETGEAMLPVMTAERPVTFPGGIDAIAVGTGPMSPHATMTDMFVATLAAAQERVTITTPYFAPDPPLLDAIIATARRGVELKIVFPQRNDSRIVGAISRAYYPMLAKAGARIFEFRDGLLHAKTLVVDDRLALIGSSNMDRRSLDLNFENNVLFESEDIARKVVEHQRRWLANAVEVDHDRVTKRPIPRRFIDNLLTMAAPLF